MRRMRLLCSAAIGLLTAACAPKAAEEKPVGMPNPASVYCTEQGGKLEIRDGGDGQTGYCHLPDGRVVEEWEFFRSKPADGAA